MREYRCEVITKLKLENHTFINVNLFSGDDKVSFESPNVVIDNMQYDDMWSEMINFKAILYGVCKIIAGEIFKAGDLLRSDEKGHAIICSKDKFPLARALEDVQAIGDVVYVRLI